MDFLTKFGIDKSRLTILVMIALLMQGLITYNSLSNLVQQLRMQYFLRNSSRDTRQLTVPIGRSLAGQSGVPRTRHWTVSILSAIGNVLEKINELLR